MSKENTSSKKKTSAVESMAVRYRPTRFEDVVGHDAAVKKLQGILKTSQVPSAVMFVGGTGVGKTTMARMLTKYLNCRDLSACGTCSHCKLDVSPDYEELNMASTRGIEDIRQLTARAKNRPRIGNMRIFFLDEVHMLTGAAANAFLKSLEEPPEHTLWILATSEPNKVLDTILGRCMVLSLNPLSREDIAKRLKYIAKKEKVDVSKKVLKKLAELSGGHVRDSISMLESIYYYLNGGGSTDEKEILKFVVLDSFASSKKEIETAALATLIALHSQDQRAALRATIDVKDGHIEYVNKMMYLNQYIIDYITLAGEKHANVWHTSANIKFRKLLEQKVKKVKLKRAIKIQAGLVELRAEIQKFLVPEKTLVPVHIAAMVKSDSE